MKHAMALILLSLVITAAPAWSQDTATNGHVRVGLYNGAVTDTAEWGKRLYFGGAAENNDSLWMTRYNVARDRSEVRVCVGNDYPSAKDKFIVGCDYDATGRNILVVQADGKVGVNTSTLTEALNVNGYVYATQAKIILTGWADHVFDSSYHLRSVSELAGFIAHNGHLPEMPSAVTIDTNGINTAEISKLRQLKIEELFLYLIAQQKRKQELLQLLVKQQQQLAALKAYHRQRLVK
ncbi:hypothetical protein [Filimonas effusa]|uniref:Uncharacterized protein n=1 Tax=Filimonas effusa TaxID=2508721 RepID=A0A4Q1DBM4_9BACT|nr:hypothetical protein [Filimonas effusa]RXK86842.1 hypothetical protein ESB13_08615 [Filimonas effusa]